MKFVLWILCNLALFLDVEGELFEFGDRKNKTCILLNMDAGFNLTYREGNVTQNAELFDLNGASVVESSSECGDETFNAILMVRLFPSREKLKFTFEREKNGHISMKADLYVNPAKHFDNMNDTSPFEMKNSGNLFIGYVAMSNYSFVCHSLQKLYFNSDEPFVMTMNITDLQVQAYDVTDSDFGPAIECEQDPTTSQATITALTVEPWNDTTTEPSPESTTEPVPETTSTPLDVTTTEPANETTTEPHTETTATTIHTTTEPIPSVPKYVVKDGNKVCIVLQGDILFDIQYQKKDSSASTAKVTVPVDAVVNGTCRLNNSETAQQITLEFFKSSWLLDIIIARNRQGYIAKTGLNIVTADDGNYSWQKVVLNYVVDDHFADAKDAGKVKSVEKDLPFGNFTSDITGSYKCKAEQTLAVGNDRAVKMVLSNMQYRAFGNTASSDFPNEDVTECEADKQSKKDTGSKTLGIVLGCVFGGLAVIILAAGVVWRVKKHKRNTYKNM